MLGLYEFKQLVYENEIDYHPSAQITDIVSYCRSRVPRLFTARSHTFAEIDHEIISTAILLPSADSRREVGSYKQKYVHEELVN